VAIDSGSWKYVYWGGFIAQFLSLAAIFAFYKPPKHPKGIPWHEAIKDLDYIGAAIIVPGICLALVGIINTTYKPSSDPTVIAPMVVGFVLIACFGVWENMSSVKHKLCPPHLFKSHNGREFTAPFIVAFIVTMFYYSANIIWVRPRSRLRIFNQKLTPGSLPWLTSSISVPPHREVPSFCSRSHQMLALLPVPACSWDLVIWPAIGTGR
jgi:hypothetical protein